MGGKLGRKWICILFIRLSNKFILFSLELEEALMKAILKVWLKLLILLLYHRNKQQIIIIILIMIIIVFLMIMDSYHYYK